MRATDFPDDASWGSFEDALRQVEAPDAPVELLARCLAPAERVPTILVVGDEPRIRQLIRLHLERAGWRVEEAVDGVAALARVPELRPDLVVLDVMMPGPSGFDVVTVLKSDPRTTDILVVMLTAKDDYDDIRRGWNRGADCYFCKPFNPWELCATIGRMLAVRGTPEEPAPLRPWLK